MKLISICPSNTEIVEYLGLTSSLIGVDDFSDWPKEIKGLPRLGPDLNIDMDKVEKLEPDLVLASLSVPGMERNIMELKKRNIPYIIVPNPKTLTEIGKSLLVVGEATNTTERAKLLYEKYN
ncbi:MAG: cobalamin-binding protein, partial [Neobacillus sp.]|nr:cobalamin-binding protein [Neobacillus sp.]